MSPVEITRTIYPRLPDIPDEKTLAIITTVESQERTFTTKVKEPRLQYLRILYLKAMVYLRHSRFVPGDLPRRMLLQLVTELKLSREFADIRKIHSIEKSRIVSDVRKFLKIVTNIFETLPKIYSLKRESTFFKFTFFHRFFHISHVIGNVVSSTNIFSVRPAPIT
jgi:hypothetical protein